MLTDTFAPPDVETSAEFYAPVSPFTEAVEAPARGESEGLEALAPEPGLESPFRSEYAGEQEMATEGPEREAFQTAIASLHETEFNEAVYELAAEAAAERLEGFGESEAATVGETLQFFENYMAPLGSEAESVFERLGEQYASHDISTLTETEVDRLFESMQPSMGHLTPAFENFFGALWKKAKSVAKFVVKTAKAGLATVGKIIPLGWVFDKLKGLVKPLLKRVLQYAMGRLPAALRPAATALAARLFGEAQSELEAGLGTEAEAQSEIGEQLAGPDPDVIQREFDARVATLFFTPDAAEQEAVVREAAQEAELEGVDREMALEIARERFIGEVTHLEQGEDLTAQLENFLPAVMAVLRLGVTVIGRQRVVGFLAGYLSSFLTKQLKVSSSLAKPLSDAIVSTGMSIVGLEAPPERETLAGEAVANTVEGTLRRLAEQGPQVFEDQRVLEAAVGEAFAAAVAESFPPSMVRSELHEVSARRAGGTWVLRPAHGRRRYKKYTQALDVTLTPQIAAVLEGFGCVPLPEILRSRFGVAAPIKARAYLYEAVCGTTISAIARHEKAVPGLGPSGTQPWELFLPLTRQAAGTLFGEPGLGRDVATQFVISPRRIAVGQRFVVLVPDGARPLTGPTPMPGGVGTVKPIMPPRVVRQSQVNLTLDFPRNQAAIHVYLSDADTQAVSASMRRGESATPALLLVRNIYVATLRSMLSGQARRHVKLVHEAAATEAFAGAALSQVGGAILSKISDKLLAFVGQALSEYLTRRRQEFLTAAGKQSGGVTIIVLVRHNSMMQVLQRAIRGDALGVGLALTKALLAPADIAVQTVPGFRS